MASATRPTVLLNSLRVMQRFARGYAGAWHPMDLYVRGRYLAAVERVAAPRSFFSWIGDSRGGMIVSSRTQE